MKNASCLLVLLLVTLTGFSQQVKKNGTIYIEHPNLVVVNKSVEAYLKNDPVANKKYFADTAKVWGTGMYSTIKIDEALKMWSSDFDYYDDIKLKQFGYPDYLEYNKDNVKVVQSWWIWSGKSKKTGKEVKVNFVQFDFFNSAGKIVMESSYGDFYKIVKE